MKNWKHQIELIVWRYFVENKLYDLTDNDYIDACGQHALKLCDCGLDFLTTRLLLEKFSQKTRE